jgi:methylglyoxal synthase
MRKVKRIGLVAHDNRKKDLLEWVEWNWKTLIEHEMICTGTTGKLIEEFLIKKTAEHKMKPPKVTKLRSGPLGGDQQLGAMITEGKIDMFIFLWDPMQPQPHDVDVKALLRITVLYNIPTACNRASADFIISSRLMNSDYKRILIDYSKYIQRSIDF